jgi:DNA-binding transcriptional regulator YdaS (Cro superfamily)
MNLIQYRDKHAGSGRDVWGDLAGAVGSSKAYISQIAHGHRRASAEMARDIEIKTNGEVTRDQLRPDLFGPLEDAAA